MHTRMIGSMKAFALMRGSKMDANTASQLEAIDKVILHGKYISATLVPLKRMLDMHADPNDSKIRALLHLRKGICFREMNDVLSAGDSFWKALTNDPLMHEAHTELCFLYLKSGDPSGIDEAAKCFEKARGLAQEAGEDPWRALIGLGYVSMRRKDLEGAMNYFEAARKCSVEGSMSVVDIAESELCMAIGIDLRADGQYERAFKFLLRGKELDPQRSEEFDEEVFFTFFKRGISFLENGSSKDEVKAAFSQLLQSFPNEKRALVELMNQAADIDTTIPGERRQMLRDIAGELLKELNAS